MFFWRGLALPALAGLCAIAPGAGAQAAWPPYATSITLTGGVTAGSHVDRNASPLHFSGMGYAGTLGFRRAMNRWTLSASLDGSRGTYSTEVASGAPGQEIAYDGRAALSLVRELGRSPRHGLGVGVFADVSGGLLRHWYADPSGAVSDYVHAVASIGPMVTWRQAIGDGMARAELAVPVAGLVHRPYADTRSVRAAPEVRAASPMGMRAITGGITYESSLRKRFGAVAAYRLRGLDLTGDRAYRGISNSISIGLVARLGAPRP